jgi:hypothetical protein
MSQITGSVGVHWWTAATHKTITEIKSVMGDLGPPEAPGAFGQPTFRCHESGTRVYCGSERSSQPIVINAPGEVCEGWWKQLAGWTDDLGAWVTRYDLANDIEPAGEARRRLRQMDSAFRRGKCETGLRARHLHQSDDGWTLYLGGKSSPLMMRAYDQRGPLRIEMQHRPMDRDVGECVPGRLLRRGVGSCWRTLAQTVAFPMTWYRELIEGEAEILPNEMRTEAALEDVVEQLRKQWGGTFWALQQLGLTLGELMSVPVSLRGSKAAKFRSWAAAAEALGYDSGKLRREVDRLCPKSN